MHRHPSPQLPPRNRPSPNSVGVALLDSLQQLDDSKQPRRFAADLHFDEAFTLFVDGKALKADDREAMLAKMRTGEGPTALEVEAVTYIQRDTPNRKFVRFADKAMKKVAASFAGQPFLRDHNSSELDARGGTILSSALEEKPDGTKQIRMRLKLVKQWAIEGALDGTIDRFSIGWSRTDVVLCSMHKTQALTKCNCYPGDPVLDAQGKRTGEYVQFIFTGAEGTEVSAVNVPAVVGTGVQTISQLAALDRATLADILSDGTDRERDQKETNPMILPVALLAALGLPSTASVEDAIGRITANADALTISNGKIGPIEEQLRKLQAEEATRLSAMKKISIDTAITTLVAGGKLKPGSEMEAALRRMGERDVEALAAQVKDLLATGAQVTPVGSALLATGADPVTVSKPGEVLSGKEMLAANPSLGPWLKKAGITLEQFEKNGEKAREMVAQMEAQR
jgi:hypothetical protein